MVRRIRRSLRQRALVLVVIALLLFVFVDYSPPPPPRILPETLNHTLVRAHLLHFLRQAKLSCPTARLVPLHSSLFQSPSHLAVLPYTTISCLQTALANSSNPGGILLTPVDDSAGFWRFKAALEDGSELVERAMLKPRLERVKLDREEAELWLPTDPERFVELLEWSELRDCNRSIAAAFKPPEKIFEMDPQLPRLFVESLAYLRDLLWTDGAPTILWHGSLLGWRRECGLIPFVSDLDIATPYSYYSAALEMQLTDQRLPLKLTQVVGKPKDSLTMTFWLNRWDARMYRVKVDLYFLYPDKSGSGGSWVASTRKDSRQKLRYDNPPLGPRLCTGELLGQLFWVPCDADAFLRASYGPRWDQPQASWLWYQDPHNLRTNGFWSSAEWPFVYRNFSAPD